MYLQLSAFHMASSQTHVGSGIPRNYRAKMQIGMNHSVSFISHKHLALGNVAS